MKLTTITMVTVDGVMQGLGAPDEDRRGGFERGGRGCHHQQDQCVTTQVPDEDAHPDRVMPFVRRKTS